MDPISAMLIALKASAAGGDREAAEFLRMFEAWATSEAKRYGRTPSSGSWTDQARLSSPP